MFVDADGRTLLLTRPRGAGDSRRAAYMREYTKTRIGDPKYKADIKRSQSKNNRKYKMLVLAELGARCTCCGETSVEFLTVDHINNDGAAERKKEKGRSMWKIVFVSGFDKARYQILCFNCNISKGINGYCPHGAAQSLYAVA